MKSFSKQLLTLLFLFTITFVFFAQEVKPTTPIKVACIGNSITFGAGIENREKDSYPSVLGRLLGEKYEVKNFGFSGRTMLRKGDNPYWNEQMFQDAIAYNPNIVIIKLGTNDSKPYNWKYKDEFEKDYRDFVDVFKNLTSKPKIFVCKPVPAFRINFDIRDSIIVNDIIPIIERISKNKNVEIIDLYKPFEGKEILLPDGIHPNEAGAALIAKVIYKAIIEKEASEK